MGSINSWQQAIALGFSPAKVRSLRQKLLTAEIAEKIRRERRKGYWLTKSEAGTFAGARLRKSAKTLLELELGARADGCRFVGRDRLLFAVGFLLSLLAALADVDSALEEGAVFDRDARGDHVAGQRTVAADIDAVAGGQISANFAEDDDLPGIDVGGYHAVAANRNAIAGKIDGPFYSAIDI